LLCSMRREEKNIHNFGAEVWRNEMKQTGRLWTGLIGLRVGGSYELFRIY